MKPPKCRVCEACHWSYEAHVFKDVATKPVATPLTVATQHLTQVEQKVLKKALLSSVELKHAGERKPKADARPRRKRGMALTATRAASRPTESERVQKWREANRERYNKRMRDYRARKKPLGIPYG